MGLVWGLLKIEDRVEERRTVWLSVWPLQSFRALSVFDSFRSLLVSLGTSSSIFKGVQYFHNTEFTNFSTIGG